MSRTPAWRVLAGAAVAVALGIAAVPVGAPDPGPARPEPAHAPPDEPGADDALVPVDTGTWAVPGMNEAAWQAASEAYAAARARGEVERPIVTVIDYSLPSSEPRLWVVDMDAREVLFHELVAHGRNSGELVATRFSNVPESRQTSLGVFRTAETYTGKHGLSLRLDGLEAGVNDLARDRDIVIHGASYVSADVVRSTGRLGRSWGCPAVRREVSDAIIETIAEGTLLVAWYPDDGWLGCSAYLGAGDGCAGAAPEERAAR